MNFRFSEEQEGFRQEVRDFLEEELRQGTFEPKCDAWLNQHSPKFTKKLAQRGWLGLMWPKEYGGQGRSYMDRLILTEELLRYGAPLGYHFVTERQIGTFILEFGTEEQKREFLPGIIKGETCVGLGIHEPQAGSDTAALQPRAVEDGDYYVINGQKVWTSGAMNMNYVYLLARTDTQAPKAEGISAFLVDTTLTGITIHLITDIAGGQHFTEVFYDDVRVHKKYLLGEKNYALRQLATMRAYEWAGIERVMGNYPLFEAITQFVRETNLSKDTLIRHKMAQLQVEFEVGCLLVYRANYVMDKGRAPEWEGAMAKAYGASFEQHLASTAIEILGLYGQLVGKSKWTPILGIAPYAYLYSKAYGITGMTSEFLRNVIASKGLGLPASN
jgi:alkylation response protein AidB-like acyl-CoA dehydrogenase